MIAGIALVVILTFGRGSTPATESAASGDVAALQAENAQLLQTIKEMQRREAQYQSEIETANETIAQLTAQWGMVNGETQGGFLQPFADDNSQFDQGQFQDPRFFGNGRMFERHGFGESQQFLGETTQGF